MRRCDCLPSFQLLSLLQGMKRGRNQEAGDLLNFKLQMRSQRTRPTIIALDDLRNLSHRGTILPLRFRTEMFSWAAISIYLTS